MAASVLLVHDARPAAADHGNTATIWDATLTVAGVIPYTGCQNALPTRRCTSADILTDDDFTYEGSNYAVIAISYGETGVLGFSFDTALPAGLRDVATLHVNGVALNLADAKFGTDESVLTWTVSDQARLPRWRLSAFPLTVTISLTAPGTPPPSGVELSTETLAVTEGGSATFTVALSADPGTDTTVTLLKTQYNQPGVGADNHRWNVNAATVAPESLTFTAGTSGNWGTAQTVTVTGVDDADSCSEQLVILVLKDTTGGESEYGALGGSITGVSVTVTDDDGGSCGGV